MPASHSSLWHSPCNSSEICGALARVGFLSQWKSQLKDLKHAAISRPTCEMYWSVPTTSWQIYWFTSLHWLDRIVALFCIRKKILKLRVSRNVFLGYLHPTNMTWSLPISGNYHMVGACGAFAVEPAGDHDSNVSKSITCEDWESIHRKAKIIKISMWPFIKIPLIPKLWYSNPSQHQAQTSRKKYPKITNLYGL